MYLIWLPGSWLFWIPCFLFRAEGERITTIQKQSKECLHLIDFLSSFPRVKVSYVLNWRIHFLSCYIWIFSVEHSYIFSTHIRVTWILSCHGQLSWRKTPVGRSLLADGRCPLYPQAPVGRAQWVGLSLTGTSRASLCSTRCTQV